MRSGYRQERLGLLRVRQGEGLPVRGENRHPLHHRFAVVDLLRKTAVARGREVESEDEDVASANAPQPPESPSVARSLPDYTKLLLHL